VRGVHHLSVDPPTLAPGVHKAHQLDLTFRPVVALAPFTGTVSSWITTNNPTWTGMANPLPPNVQLLTAHSRSPNTFLLRLAHNFEVRP